MTPKSKEHRPCQQLRSIDWPPISDKPVANNEVVARLLALAAALGARSDPPDPFEFDAVLDGLGHRLLIALGRAGIDPVQFLEVLEQAYEAPTTSTAKRRGRKTDPLIAPYFGEMMLAAALRPHGQSVVQALKSYVDRRARSKAEADVLLKRGVSAVKWQLWPRRRKSTLRRKPRQK